MVLTDNVVKFIFASSSPRIIEFNTTLHLGYKKSPVQLIAFISNTFILCNQFKLK
jgi:hypothetical protein